MSASTYYDTGRAYDFPEDPERYCDRCGALQVERCAVCSERLCEMHLHEDEAGDPLCPDCDAYQASLPDRRCVRKEHERPRAVEGGA